MSDEGIKARLVAAREALEALIEGMRAALNELHGGWGERAEMPAPRPLRGLVAVDGAPGAQVECFACARAARQSNGGRCNAHRAMEAL